MTKVENPNLTVMLAALNVKARRTGSPFYMATVSEKTKARRRRRNKIARLSRRANR